MNRRHATRKAAAFGLAAAVCLLAGGCAGGLAGDENRRLAIDLAQVLEREAQKLPDEGPRERLAKGLAQIRELLVGEVELKPVESGAPGPAVPQPKAGPGADEWFRMFAPKGLMVGFFTRSRDFDGRPGDDGLEVRIQPLDQFGDPTKAVGSYRIEVFQHQYRTLEKRGPRLGHWFVEVLDAAGNRRYYDPIDRSYVLPLLWDRPIAAGTAVIVQVTYYPPAGFQEKLIAQRVVKIGAD